MRNSGRSMRITKGKQASAATAVSYRRCTIGLGEKKVKIEEIPCRNWEEALGGVGRSLQLLAEREVTDAYSPENPLVVNTGLLTGSGVMTGAQVYFSGYSPLKRSRKGLPAAMWSAASGEFGRKLKGAGLDEIVFEGRAAEPVCVVFRQGANGAEVTIEPAPHLLGLTSHDKIMALRERYDDAHFAAIGPAGENFSRVLMGAVALSTESQLDSGEASCSMAWRGGMGSLMGYKNVLALVAQSGGKPDAITQALLRVNGDLLHAGGSNRFQPLDQGGGGGTWTDLEVLNMFGAAPENNFRPSGKNDLEGLYRDNIGEQFEVRGEACTGCGIRCHNDLHRRNDDGSAAGFLARFDYDPLCALGANLGVHQPEKVAELIGICRDLALDPVSLGATISFVLDYNSRQGRKIMNGATFGDHRRIRDLVEETGRGGQPMLGQGVLRLSESLGETSFAMQVKGLELPPYLAETNPGYAFAVGSGESMATQWLAVREGGVGLEDWVQAVTQQGLLRIGYDMIGLCSCTGVDMGDNLLVRAINAATGLRIDSVELTAAVRRVYLRGLALELKQGYQDEEYALPERVFDQPNPNLELPHFVTREFFASFKERVWEVLLPELEDLASGGEHQPIERRLSA